MSRKKLKYYKKNNIIIYPSTYAESINSNLIKTSYELNDESLLQLDEINNVLILQEVTSYTVEILDDSVFQSEDFKLIGTYVSKKTGILKFINFIGYGSFKGLNYTIVSQKITEESYRFLLEDIQTSYLDLVYDFHNPTALKSKNTSRKQLTVEYHKLKLILSMLEHRRPEKNIYKILDRIIANPFKSYYIKSHNVSIYEAISPSDLDLPNIVSGKNEFYELKKNKLSNSSFVNGLNRNIKMRVIPTTLAITENMDTFDNHENRFIKYFISLMIHYLKTLEKMIIRKGIYGYNEDLIISIRKHKKNLNKIFTSEFFRHVSPMSIIPHQSQALNKLEGYREIYHYFNIMNNKHDLVFDDEIDNLIDSKRIDKLYELWCFFKIVNVFKMINYGQSEANLTFKINKEKVLFSEKNDSCFFTFANYSNKGVEIRIYFQKHYSSGKDTYTLNYDPDISLEVFKEKKLNSRIFFDAKYRVDFDDNEVGRFKPEDINKMHAYIDAIKLSKGSYILYPGDIQKVFQVEKSNIIPSIGALVLKPGDVSDDVKLLEFVKKITKELFGE